MYDMVNTMNGYMGICLKAFPFFLMFFQYVIFYCNVFFNVMHVQTFLFQLVEIWYGL